MSIPTRAGLDALIREELDCDPEFRAQLLADPRATLGALVGTRLPDFIEVTVHVESLTAVHLVMPAPTGDEIAEDDLELVAGGTCWTDSCTAGLP